MDLEEVYTADERRRHPAELQFRPEWNDENGRARARHVGDPFRRVARRQGVRGNTAPQAGGDILEPRHGSGGLVEVEIGIGKSGRRAYGFDEIAIVPSRRTRDPEDVDITWEIDAFKFGLPLIAAGMDGVTSPATAIEIGKLGGIACLNLEGLWTKYEDPD